MSEGLWKEFNLGEQNHDIGGGLLYCLRYSSEMLEYKRDEVISALDSKGLKLEEHDEELAIVPPDNFDQSELKGIFSLVEELSVLNDALDYANNGLGEYNSVFDLRNGIMTNYFRLFQSSMADAYNFADMSIPDIARELYVADNQNNVLSSSERKNLDSLVSFAKRQVDMLNKPGGYVIIGLKDIQFD